MPETMQIGIPRAMSYYNYFPFWYGFFEGLGIKVVLSDKTTKQTMSSGSALVVSETCLPIKVYVGHILNLLEKGVDKIFVPSIQSIDHKIYNCSKIRGLPDLIRNVVKKDFTIVEATLDKSEKNQGLYAFLKEAAAPFGITDEKLIKQASKEGWKVMNNFKIMLNSGLSFEKALSYAKKGQVVITNNQKSYPISVAVLAHSYNLFDDRISMKIFDKLEKLDVKTYTSEQLSIEQLKEGSKARINAYNTLVPKDIDYNNQQEMSKVCNILEKLRLNIEEYNSYLEFLPLFNEFKDEYINLVPKEGEEKNYKGLK